VNRKQNDRLMLLSFVLIMLSFALAITAVVILLVDDETNPAPAQLKPASQSQPYGGCDEAARYPGTPGYDWCVKHGRL
jgi:hypothetical protein